MSSDDPIYVDLASESDDPCVTQIGSLCLACNGKGITKLLMTKIPHFKEIILMSFECNECGHRNNSVQSSSWEDRGIKYELKVSHPDDLKRQIVTSGHCRVLIPEVELEIPPDQERGQITTVEGVLRRVMSNLSSEQEERRKMSLDLAEQIDAFIKKLEGFVDLTQTFSIIVDDPSGNSYVESLPDSTSTIRKDFYHRSKEQNEAMGLYEQPSEDMLETIEEVNGSLDEDDQEEPDFNEEVLSFSTICDQCSKPSSTKMKVTKVPHFREVIIMASECSYCGYRTNEVKSGGGVEEKGRKISLKISASIDMSRDLLKSETCSIAIPELDLYVGAGIVVAKFTTVEGLLTDIKEDLAKNPFVLGDSICSDRRAKVTEIVTSIQKVIDGSLSIHLVLDDPVGNSYLQNICSPDPDPALTIEDYERSFEQNEELGFNDMKTENYAETESCPDVK